MRKNTLSLTTEKFLALLDGSDDDMLNLSFASDFLNVPRRRMYDIVNVLEGAGLLQKETHGTVTFKENAEIIGERPITSEQESLVELLAKEKEYDRIIEELDRTIEDMVCSVSHSSFLYLKHSDIRCLPDLKNETILKISPPEDIVLEVPKMKKNRSKRKRKINEDIIGHELYLNGNNKPIDVYLVAEENEIEIKDNPLDHITENKPDRTLEDFLNYTENEYNYLQGSQSEKDPLLDHFPDIFGLF
eukprot:GHVP01014662.1.p1 GENE.GHVP01014662.1~~GHVP01014662.1.p1  ORF type:complete len:246 (-),score=63.08 GHVP01014662.1:369-1106(-)